MPRVPTDVHARPRAWNRVWRPALGVYFRLNFAVFASRRRTGPPEAIALSARRYLTPVDARGVCAPIFSREESFSSRAAVRRSTNGRATRRARVRSTKIDAEARANHSPIYMYCARTFIFSFHSRRGRAHARSGRTITYPTHGSGFNGVHGPAADVRAARARRHILARRVLRPVRGLEADAADGPPPALAWVPDAPNAVLYCLPPTQGH